LRSTAVRRTLLAAVSLVAILCSGVLIAGAATAPKPKQMKVACAGSNAVMRYVARASSCKKTEKVVTFDANSPIDACVKLHGTSNGVRGSLGQLRAARRLPAGTTRLSPPADCPARVQPNEIGIVLPGPKKTWFCARGSDGRLRWVSRRSKCTTRERGIWVPQGSPVRAPEPSAPQGQGQGNKAPKTSDDSETTDEDAPIAINVLANDTDDDGDPLSIESVNTNGTTGTVTPNANGTISYDPAGKFDNLKPGQTAFDNFKYKAQDNRGGKSGETRVDVTIRGKNLAPKAANDTGSTGEETATNVTVLANDTDPEGDTLSLGPIDDAGTAGDVSAGPGNTVAYDPNNQFEDLGVGETRLDTFKYRASDGSANSAPATVTMTVSGVNDTPTVDTTNAALAYAEGDGPKAVDTGMAVDDVDGDQLTGATVDVLDSTWFAGEDELAWADNNAGDGIALGTDNDTTGTLTLTGSGSAAEYQAALRAIVYNNNSDNPDTTPRQLSANVTDQHGATSAAATRNIDVARVNDAPLLSNAGTLNYTEGDAATAISSTLTVADIDDTQLVSGRVAITSGHESTDDLSWTDNNAGDGITLGTDDNTTDVLTLTGTGTLDEYRDALRAVKYASTSDNASTPKQATFRANDGDTDSNDAFADINVTGVNDKPVINLTNAALAYSEGDGAVPIDGSVALTDPENDQISGASVDAADASWVAAEDELAWADNNGADSIVQGTDNDATGTLTLTGNGTLAQYEAAIEAIHYANNSDNPNTTARELSATVTDVPGATSDADTRNINVARVNDAPLLSNAGTLNYTEGQAATAVTSTLTVEDIDDTNLESARVAISPGQQSDDDLSWADNNGADGITLDADDNTNDVITLTGSGTKDEYRDALRAVKYENTGSNPTGPKQVTFRANDGDTNSNDAFADINIAGDNDPPTVNLTDAALSYQEGSGAVAIDNNVTVTDADSANLNRATISLSAGNVPAEDDLAWVDNNGSDNITMTSDVDTAPATLVLEGAGTPAQYEAAINAVTYENSSESPATASRTLSVKARDDANAEGPADTRALTVVSVNDAPVVTTSSGPVAYTEGQGSAVTVDGGVTVTDADDTNIEGAQVRLSSGFQSGDELDFVNQNNITHNYNSGTGVLTLTGTDTVANYQTALRSIQFESTNNNPVSSKTVEFKVNDGDVDSNTATREIVVTPVNSPPTVDATNSALSYTEDDPATAVDSGLTVDDPENDSLSGGSASITANYQAGQDFLNWTDNNPADNVTLDNINTNQQTIVLTGVGTEADYQAALRAVTFSNNSQNPSNVNRTVTFSATDVPGLTGSDTRTIAVTNVDDPPVAVNDSATVLEDAAATSVPVLTNDTDIDGGPKTISSATDPANGTVVLTGGSPGAHTGLTYQPDPNYCNDPPGTTPDTFNYTVNGGSSATVSMTVTCVNDAPVADDETFNGNDSAHGNTTLQGDDPSDDKPAPTNPHTEITGDILAGDTDIDGPGPLEIADTDGTPDGVDHRSTNDGGSVTIEADGDFVFQPAASTSCTDTSDFFDYTVTDNGSPAANDTGRVTIAIAGCVWYVNNNDPTGNSGTSTAPFDTLAQAETASGNNHTVFVYDGNNTSTGYDTGFAMNSGERLIGEHEGLTVDPDGGGALNPDTLHPANAGARPTLTANNEDVVALDDSNEVRGFNIEPQGTGSGIAGASGDTGGATVDDVNIVDTGVAGTQPALELDSTTGTFNLTNLVVNNSAAVSPPSTAIGVRLNNAGTVNFLNTGLAQISITTNGAKGLDATGTNMGTSTIDDITVTNSSTGALEMLNTTGSTTLGDNTGADLNLTTTSGSAAAFRLTNAGSVSVGGGGTVDDVHATGGPAVDVTGTSNPTLDFDDVDSTNSANDGINLDSLGTGTFSANDQSAIGGAAGILFDVNGGSGSITYAGALNDGSGTTAVEVTNRTGGTVTFSGPLTDDNDAGGGINLSSNSAASVTRFDGGVTLSTGSSHGVAGSSGGTLAMTDPVGSAANTVETTTGSALSLSNTTIHDDDLTFLSINASNPVTSGIALNTTSNANGRLVVTGNSAGVCGGDVSTANSGGFTAPTVTNPNTADCTGGTIASAGDAGVSLNAVPGGVSLTRMRVNAAEDDGINANTVGGGVTLNRVLLDSNGDAAGDRGLEFTSVTGTSSITTSSVTGSADDNANWENNGTGSLALTVANSRFADNSAVTGADGIHIRGGTGNPTMTASIHDNAFIHNRDDGFQLANTTPSSAQMNVTFSSNDIVQGVNNVVNNDTIHASNGSDADTRFKMDNNDLTGAHGSAVILNPGPDGTSASTFDAIVTNNTIGTGAVDSGSVGGIGLWGRAAGNGVNRFEIRNNLIQNYQTQGMYLRGNEGIGQQTSYTVTGNNIGTQDGSSLVVLLEAGSISSDATSVCADFGGAGALANTVFDRPAGNDIGVARDIPTSTLNLVNYAGGDLTTYFRGRNGPPTITAVQSGTTPGNAGASCALPATPPLP
jgi:hypothetical protein